MLLATSAVIIVQAILIALLVRARSGRKQPLIEQARAATDLREAQAKNKAILTALPDMMFLLASEEEKRRIARALHDVTLQNLFAVTINLGNLLRRRVNLSSTDLEIFTECQNLCEQTLTEVRTLSYLFRPPALECAGLIPMLQWYLDGFSKSTGVAVALHVSPSMRRLPLDLETDLFRIVQGALFDFLGHSAGRSAIISLEEQTGHVVVKIRNAAPYFRDGAEEPDVRCGVGLRGMQERLCSIGGRLEILSDDAGIFITAQVPVSTEKV